MSVLSVCVDRNIQDLLSPDPPWSQLVWDCRSSPPPQSWSGLPELRCRPAWSCPCWAPCCRTPCCTCSWGSSPWCAAPGREAWETSGASLLNLVEEKTERLSECKISQHCFSHHTTFICQIVDIRRNHICTTHMPNDKNFVNHVDDSMQDVSFYAFRGTPQVACWCMAYCSTYMTGHEKHAAVLISYMEIWKKNNDESLTSIWARTDQTFTSLITVILAFSQRFPFSFTCLWVCLQNHRRCWSFAVANLKGR